MSSTAGSNWSQNVDYRAARLHLPRSVEEVQSIVAGSPAVRALGSRHSFNTIADTTGDLISLEQLDVPVTIDASSMTVTAGAGMRYGELGAELQAAGYALANLASLPHISVAGAVTTATHGSGNGNGNLASSVAALTLVLADGSLLTLTRGDADFAGAVVGLGSLGILVSMTLDIEPTFDVAVNVFENLPWEALLASFDEITGAAYSVSCFTDWSGTAVDQVWLKHRITASEPTADAATAGAFFGATPATVRRHPLPGISAEACTEQLGIPGAWIDRLPHFRLDFTPSNGAELQTEYMVPREHAAAAITALRALGSKITPLLYVSEIRTMTADNLWLSMAYGRDTVAFHFTWQLRQAEVELLLPEIEAALAPFSMRPHWGKLATLDAAALASLYPRHADFVALAERLDPTHVFRNDFVEAKVFAVTP
jgi:xylitol oxidase